MRASSVRPMLLASAALATIHSVAAQSTYTTTIPFVATYCPIKVDNHVCHTQEYATGTFGYYEITEVAGPSGTSQLGPTPSCPVQTAAPTYDIGIGQISSTFELVPGCPGPTSVTPRPEVTNQASLTTAIPTGHLSVTPVPTVSISMFHNAAATPVAQAALAAAGAVGVVAAML